MRVVSEDNIRPRIRAEVQFESPTDRDERVPSSVHHSEGTYDSISQGLRRIGRPPSSTDPHTHPPAGDPPTGPCASETHCQHRSHPERDPPLGGASQCVGSLRRSVATSVVGQNIEAVLLETPGQRLSVRMILPAARPWTSTTAATGGLVEGGQWSLARAIAVACEQAVWPRCSFRQNSKTLPRS
jgi:hypothetical protein